MLRRDSVASSNPASSMSLGTSSPSSRSTCSTSSAMKSLAQTRRLGSSFKELSLVLMSSMWLLLRQKRSSTGLSNSIMAMRNAA